MTSGERAVWAAEFVRQIGEGMHASNAARGAEFAVRQLRGLGRTLGRPGDDPARVEEINAMLADMLSTGADR